MAEVVIVCEPEQASLMMGGLHPRGSLYERPVDIDSAKSQHGEFRKARAGRFGCMLRVFRDPWRMRLGSHACVTVEGAFIWMHYR